MNNTRICIEDIPRYADVSHRVIGNQTVKVSDLLDVPIVIWKFEVLDSIYRKKDKDPNKHYMKFQFSYEKDPGPRFVAGTSSYYLISDVEEVREFIPIRATIRHKELPKKSSEDKARYAYVLS